MGDDVTTANTIRSLDCRRQNLSSRTRRDAAEAVFAGAAPVAPHQFVGPAEDDIRLQRNDAAVLQRPGVRLRLKVGVSPDDAALRLAALISEAANVTAVAGGGRAIIVARDRYLTWVEQVEGFLTSVTHDQSLISELYTPHYWQIRALEWNDVSGLNDPRPYPLFYAEATRQANALQRLFDDLTTRRSRLSVNVGYIGVLDTNVLLHYQPVDQIPWASLIGSPDVRLVIPLRVIEEIDAKKYSGSSGLAKRARKLLPALERLLDDKKGAGVLAPGVTLQVPVDTGHRERPDDADEEILFVSCELAQFSSRDVTMITGDTGMMLRARAHGLKTLRLPDNLLRAREPTT